MKKLIFLLTVLVMAFATTLNAMEGTTMARNKSSPVVSFVPNTNVTGFAFAELPTMLGNDARYPRFVKVNMPRDKIFLATSQNTTTNLNSYSLTRQSYFFTFGSLPNMEASSHQSGSFAILKKPINMISSMNFASNSRDPMCQNALQNNSSTDLNEKIC
ncbi:MAG: hypothetical protein WCO07_01155 [bacterium]